MMLRRCSWCSRWLGFKRGPWGVTHTACERCRAALFAGVNPTRDDTRLVFLALVVIVATYFFLV